MAAAAAAAVAAAMQQLTQQQAQQERDYKISLDDLTDRASFHNWNFKFLGELDRLGIRNLVMDALDQGLAAPPGPLLPADTKKIAQLTAKVRASLKPPSIELVSSDPDITLVQILRALRRRYGSEAPVDKNSMYRAFTSTIWNPSSQPLELFTQQKYRQALMIPEFVPIANINPIMRSVLLSCMPPSFGNLCSELRQQDLNRDWREVEARLIDADSSGITQKTEKSTTVLHTEEDVNALVSTAIDAYLTKNNKGSKNGKGRGRNNFKGDGKGKGKNKSGGKGKGKGKGRGGGKGKGVNKGADKRSDGSACWRCGGAGHRSWECQTVL